VLRNGWNKSPHAIERSWPCKKVKTALMVWFIYTASAAKICECGFGLSRKTNIDYHYKGPFLDWLFP